MQSRDCSGSKTQTLFFLTSQTEKIPEKHENGSVNGLSEISGESSSLIACFSGLGQPRGSALLIGPARPVLLCKHRLPAGPGPPVSTAGMFEAATVCLVMAWFVWQQPRRTPTAARVCLRAHVDPGDNEDVTFSHRLAPVCTHAGFMRRLPLACDDLRRCAAAEGRPRWAFSLYVD